jgi:hypothetical protein
LMRVAATRTGAWALQVSSAAEPRHGNVRETVAAAPWADAAVSSAAPVTKGEARWIP